MYIKSLSLYIILIVLLSTVPGCSLLEIHEQTKKSESAGIIKGKIKLVSSKRGPIIIHRYFLDGTTYITDSFVRAATDGEYYFNSLPGTYYLAAFVDSNKDGEYQVNEDADFLKSENGRPLPVVVEYGKTVTVKTITISGKAPKLTGNYSAKETLAKIEQNIGLTIRLDDPIFSQDNYSMGMWRPFQFLEEVGGGLFLLQDYQADKIPVLFVHGINGGPLDWKNIIDGLDQKHFQPWIIYYPSGLRLDMIAGYMALAVARMQDRYGFKKIFIAAHSMGGLVAMSYIKKYRERYPELSSSIRLLITVNSPLGGMSIAKLGVERLPIVLPVWRDLTPGSEFLQDLNAWPWPNDIPYHLVFSYVDGSSDDNIVSLQSQIPLKVQRDSVRMYGFNDTHVGTLENNSFIKLFHSILGDNLDQ